MALCTLKNLGGNCAATINASNIAGASGNWIISWNFLVNLILINVLELSKFYVILDVKSLSTSSYKENYGLIPFYTGSFVEEVVLVSSTIGFNIVLSYFIFLILTFTIVSFKLWIHQFYLQSYH